ncbi:hypothetical protein GCM10011369_36630 [Neiella marina]|uniref:DUF3545 family protein n=1 Tax=Neiella marina TaxID=508461 RepID=A0A8J2UBD9_9GAMM|nr:DUF3545 family protein [Neiella marina]GGA91207.1 hypothetical protein GCM10011369_36630 [Neiella marina]
MERLEFGYSDNSYDKPGRTTRNKRKWREIESLKEKYRLKKELEELDWAGDFGSGDLEL